ncbi:acetoacetate--CoA ligase [Lewinella sp. W8]|uniref:acetoacetate--CoA ligase n=1 Tax=Lewinella sp. W8 TaxID=2528208 RepID=UPI0010680C83|nr:acetoacetate--CoA ligase [Lewinella sp. W8]MTB49782.1 acetoacetate--CoA ligase [Lewinella sp. W8]
MPTHPVLWQPDQASVSNTNLWAYKKWLKATREYDFDTYEELWNWSTNNPADFWQSIVDYFGVNFHDAPTEVLSGKMPNVRWFAGATVNYAEHIFRQATTEYPALIFRNETGGQEVSWASLTQQVVAAQQWLIGQGIGVGDRVAAYLPNIPEAIVFFLATNGLGAVWSCCSPDFGVETVIERFGQIEPQVLIACDGYQYNGKPYSRMEEVAKLRRALPSVRATAFVPYLDSAASLPDAAAYEYITTAASEYTREDLTLRPVPFDHPIWVLYSSGTTGKPKAITHSHGGVLLEHLKYMAFHNDVKPGERFFWFTTTGWMMWNFLQASMLMGATPVLFDGSPGFPSLNRLWELSEELPIHHFGTSAPYLVACMKQGLTPGKTYDLSRLRSIGSTGAPLPAEAFDWVYEAVGEHLWLCSMSGGTDVCTAFVGGIPFAPVRRGLIQGRALGCALYAYDEAGERVSGQLGEMVIEQPMPSMPVYFWNDPGQARYRASYFSDFPGKWRHGDWIKIFPNGQLIIQGRSDATLNRKGVRIGTAEIYRVLDQIPELKDALILNLEQPDGSDHMPLFVVSDGEVDAGMREKINRELKVQCSPRHVPDEIIQVPDVPYTLSGKKMEVPVKKILLGMDLSSSLNRDAVRNPRALDWFINWAKNN